MRGVDVTRVADAALSWLKLARCAEAVRARTADSGRRNASAPPRRFPAVRLAQRRRGNLRYIQQLRRRSAVIAASASRNIVWQNGQAVPDHTRARARQFFGAVHVHALALLLAQEHLPAARAAAE